MAPLRALPKTYERDIERYLVNQIAKRLKGKVYKLSGIRGIQDRLIVLPRGIVWFVEVKREDGKISPLQVRRRKELQRLGHHTAVVWSRPEVDHLLTRIRNE